MYNRKVLIDALKKLGSAKAPTEKKDMIIDPMGQWAHPGENTRIPSDRITMKGVNYPVLGIANTGQKQMMQPGQEYNFPGADYVDEYPQMRNGGLPRKKNSKAYSRSLEATNRLFAKHPWFAKPKSRKNKIYDPNARYYQPGGELPQNAGITYLPEDDRSYYDPLSDTINLNPNASDAELNHELVHAWQNRTGRLRTNPNLPQQRPPIVASDEQAASYYTRKGDDVDYYLNNLSTLHPDLTGGNIWTEDLNRFIPDQMKYDKVIDPLMYSDPNTMEGEAEMFSQVYGPPPGISFRKNGGALTKAQKGLSHTQRMQAYDDSLAVYNMYQNARNYFNKIFANYKPDLLSDADDRKLDKWFNYMDNLNVPQDAFQRLTNLNKTKPFVKTKSKLYTKNTIKNGRYNINHFIGNFPKPKKPVMPQNQPNNFITKTKPKPVKSPCSNPITTVINNVPEKAPSGKKLVGTHEVTIPVTGKKCEYVKTINPIYEDIKIEPIKLPIIDPPLLENKDLGELQVHDYNLPDSIEAPQYTLDPYTADRLSLDVKLPQNKIAALFDRGVIDSKGHIELGKRNKTRLIPRIVQKATGYDPAYFEGYENEEGNFIPGELDYGNATGSEMEFRGAASLRDLMNQQKYKKEYEEYDKNLDTWLEQYEQSKKKQAEGRAFKYGGLSKFLDGGPQCPEGEGYTYNPETKRCERQRTDCPEGYDWDEQEGRCKSKAYREKSELYIKGNKVVPTEEQEKYPWWPDDLTIKNLEPRYNLIQPEKRLSIFKPGLSDTKYEWSPVEVEIYPDLNYQVVVDPNKPKGYNADKSIYYVPDENNFEFEKFKQYKKLKEVEKENLANLAKYPNLTTKIESGYNWEDAYLNPEYMPFSNKNKTFDEYKNIKKEEYEGCTDCTYGHGETISYDDDDRITEQNLAHVYNKFYDIPDYDTRFEREHDYIELSNDSVIPRLDLATPSEDAPLYLQPEYQMSVPTIEGKKPIQKFKRFITGDKGVIDRKGHIKFGDKDVNRPIPALVQKLTGYNPDYMEGYTDDEGNYIPGEIEKAEEAGRKINFKGASSLRDLKKQKEYDRQWLDYQNQKDEVRQQNEAYLQEYDITPEEYEQYYGPFRKGGQLPKAQFGFTGMGKDRALTATPFDFRTSYGQSTDFYKNPNYSLTYTTPNLFKMNMAANPLSFTIGSPYHTDKQRLTPPQLDMNPIYRQDYYDPAFQAGSGPQYQQYLQDVSNYSGTPVSGLNQTILNQYNAAKNLAAVKPTYKKGIPLTGNVEYGIYGNAGPFIGALNLGAGYAPEPGFYGTMDASAYGVFGKRKHNKTISRKTYFDNGLTRQGDRAWIPRLNIFNMVVKQHPDYNDAQTQKVLELYNEDIQQGTTKAEDFLYNGYDQTSSMPFGISALSPELTFQVKPFKDIPGVLSLTAGLRNTLGGKNEAETTVGGQWTSRPYGNIRYSVPLEGAIDKLKDLDLPTIKRKKTYNDYANDQEYDEEYTDDTPEEDTPTENNIEVNPPELQVNPNGTVLGRGDCPEGYERPCPKCRCQKIKMPQMYTDKRGTHLFGNEPIRFEDGGSIELELDDDQIEEYKKGGYIIEDISVPSLTKMQGGGDKLIKGLTQPTKIIRDINTIGKELLGELLQGPSNRKAIAAGNNWLDNWISHPVTQAKIEADVLNAPFNTKVNPNYFSAYSTPVYGDRAITDYDKYLYALQLAKDFKSGVTEYPILSQIDDLINDFGTEDEQIHSNSLGFTTLHQEDPFQRELYKSGYYKPNSTVIDRDYKPYRNFGSFVSRKPSISQDKRKSITVHEGTHDWITDWLLKNTGQFDLIQSLVTPEYLDFYNRWKAKDKTLTDSEKKKGYYADPTEVHARIMQIRELNDLTPFDTIDDSNSGYFMDQLLRGDVPFNGPNFAEMLGNDRSRLAKLMNDLYGIALPIGVAAGAGSLLANPYTDKSPIGKYQGGGEKGKKKKLKKVQNLETTTTDIDPDYLAANPDFYPKIVNEPEVTVLPNVEWLQDRANIQPNNIQWYESWNPKKWGLNDYSDYSSFNSAFRNARASKQDEFIYKDKRYNTDLIPKEESDLYWESKNFLKDYYQNEPYRYDDGYDSRTPSEYDTQQWYIKNKYGTTWVDLYDKIQATDPNDPKYVEMNQLLDKILEDESSIIDKTHKDYNNYRDSIVKSTKQNLINTRLSSLDKPSYFSITNQKPTSMSSDGYWDPKNNRTFMYTKTMPGKLNTTYVHELSHKGDDILDVLTTVPDIDIKKINDSPYVRSWGQEDFTYVSEPSEIEARKLSTLFYLYKNKKPYKSGKITQKMLDDLYANSENLPYDIKQLLDLYGMQQDDLLKYLNSDYSYKEQKKQYGGEHELGDEVDEATMKQLKKLGYTFEKI